MGWKISGLVVEGALDPSRLPGYPRDTGETVGIDDVLTGAIDYAVTSSGDWALVLDRDGRASFDDEALEAFSIHGRVLAFVTHSVVTLHGFAWYVDGSLVRRVFYSEGQLADEYGVAITAEERTETPLGEEDIFEIIWELTGLAWSVADDARYQRWTCTELPD
ncbi:DUF6461 domain-containing protein [Nocardia sp. NBC_01327]|uniref:DUF6461 domain-containing protein n=1 Tax=Nocardia sp. NBC_01327 TaxID=2903593 RepID=UPI002E11BC2A|nr:DUF6461 domain-containing protein [Nocardia sp. NBC_01327]